MLCAVITGPSAEEAEKQIREALPLVDLVELRLDFFEKRDPSVISRLRSLCSLPMIFTLRNMQQGGNYSLSEEKRLQEILHLLECRPEYLDCEYGTPSQYINEVAAQYPDVKLILSYHNFDETPEDLPSLYQSMKRYPAAFYKIAALAKNSLDALRLMLWLKETGGRCIAISMGEYGEVSRILGPVFGSPITYASLDDKSLTAPGQLTVQTLSERYHHRRLNPKTALYGLIGDPVQHSLSDRTHNELIRNFGLDAVYVKMRVQPSQLNSFLLLAQQLPFKGLSVTMPLKEAILSHLAVITPQVRAIGAANTLLLDSGQYTGFNTDGVGALHALGCDVKDKRVVILGAGGAARAVAHHVICNRGHVILLNRDKERALRVANELQCFGYGLDHMSVCAEEGYDILINCTPFDFPIAPDHILPKTCVMDIKSRPSETLFLQLARAKGCRIVHGIDMFMQQALGQFALWFPNIPNLQATFKKRAVD